MEAAISFRQNKLHWHSEKEEEMFEIHSNLLLAYLSPFLSSFSVLIRLWLLILAHIFKLMRELRGQWEGIRELDLSVLAAFVWLPWITAQYRINTRLCDSGIWWSVAVAGLGWWIGQKLFRSQAPLVVRVWVKLWPQFEREQVGNFLDFEYKNNFHLTYFIPPLRIY